MPELKLAEIAKRIEDHLKRFEADPMLSRRKDGKTARFWSVGCAVNGRFVAITYISYQSSSNMSKAQALKYLAKLDEGFVGRHFEALRDESSSGD